MIKFINEFLKKAEKVFFFAGFFNLVFLLYPIRFELVALGSLLLWKLADCMRDIRIDYIIYLNKKEV